MKFQVGDLVYQSFSPAKHGVVVEVIQPPATRVLCLAVKPHPDGVTTGANHASLVFCQLVSGHTGQHFSNGHAWPVEVHDDGRFCEQENCDRLHHSNAEPRFHTPMPTYVVEQPSGKRFESKTLKSVQELIDAHTRTLATHQQTFEKISAHKAKLGL